MFNKLFVIIIFTTLIFNVSCKKDPTSSNDPTALKDIDGNIYKTVVIGNQEWMAENLKVTRYRNGDAIPNITTGDVWKNMKEGAYCSYNNDDSNIEIYGLLYNWYAVDDNRNIAPEGWHIPTDAEWKELEMHLGMSDSEAYDTGWRGTDEGGKLKETGTNHWKSPNTGATNTSGFSALPGGYRYYGGAFGYVGFDSIGYTGYWWSSTEASSDCAWVRRLDYSSSGVVRYCRSERNGFSVRCIRD